MRVFLVLCVVVASAYGLGSEAPVKPAFNYLDRSIAVAKSIKETEDAIIQSQDFDKIRNYHHSRIVGGSVAPSNMYPFLAGLLLHMTHTVNLGVCGASLISSNRVLTAAHCWFDGVRQAWQVEVVLGSQFLFSGGTRVLTWQVVMHSGWTPSNFENDIAMIYLPNHVSFTPWIQPVALPFGSLLSNTFAGWWSNAAGYGRYIDGVEVQTDAQIRHAYLTVMTNNQCALSYGTQIIKSSTLCTAGTGGVGVCMGDSGGPLVVPQDGQYFLIGVSSFTADGGCTNGHPSGYARVSSFNNWILQNMW
ncbi:trypsin domain-containing protein [Phthorimaea operculella]|nr:trypsin domain-containing protein [Phthorimaea operculella]